MNDFEKRITDEYVRNHSLSLLRDAMKTADEFSDVADPGQVREHEMSVATMHRYVYLALQEYHNALSRYLAEHGISLPNLDTLVFGSEKKED